MKRMVIVTVDTLVEILKDYLGEENIPADAQVETILVKPTEQGKFAIILDSPTAKHQNHPLNVCFTLKRFFSVNS